MARGENELRGCVSGVSLDRETHYFFFFNSTEVELASAYSRQEDDDRIPRCLIAQPREF